MRRHWQFNRFVLKTGESITLCGDVREGLTGLASKLGDIGLTDLGLFGLKIGESITSCGDVREGLTSLASKPGETCLIGLSLKTKGGLGAILVRAKDTWRHLEAYVEARRSRKGGLSVRCIFLKYGWFYHCVGGYLN